MRSHYRRVIKQLARALTELDTVTANRDVAALHRLVVDLKTTLPERLSYEHSPILLDGLRVTQDSDLPEYVARLRQQLTAIHDDYARRVD